MTDEEYQKLRDELKPKGRKAKNDNPRNVSKTKLKASTKPCLLLCLPILTHFDNCQPFFGQITPTSTPSVPALLSQASLDDHRGLGIRPEPHRGRCCAGCPHKARLRAQEKVQQAGDGG